MTSQAVRRILHASSSSSLLVLYFGSSGVFRLLLIVASIAAVTLDTLRVAVPAIGAIVHRTVPVFKESESARVSGATWLCIGYGIAAWFPEAACTAGIMVGALADPAASFAGSMLADPRAKKTWMGSGAAASVSFVVLMLQGLPLVAAAIGAATATVVERWPGPLDDNLVIAPVVSLVVWLLI